jgi:hypothetical protein
MLTRCLCALQDHCENEIRYKRDVVYTYYNEALTAGKAQAQAADFYMPNQFSDTDWPDHELVNTKQGWEASTVINGNL